MAFGKEWLKYVGDLIKLQKKKEELLSIIEHAIDKCFIGIRLKFNLDIEYGINNYECNLLHKILYNLVLDLSGRVPVQVAYDNYERLIADFRGNRAIEDRIYGLENQRLR